MRYMREIKEEERVREKEGEDGIFRRMKRGWGARSGEMGGGGRGEEAKEDEKEDKKDEGDVVREKKKNIGKEKVEEGAESGRVVAEKEGKEGAGTSTAASKTTCADFDNDALRRTIELVQQLAHA